MVRPGDHLRSIVQVVLIVVVLAGPALWRLAEAPAQHPHREPLVAEPSALVSRPLPLDYAGLLDGADTFRLPLQTADVTRFLHYDEFALVFGNDLTGAVLVEASLVLRGTDCRYVTPPRATLDNNDYVWFRRSAPCQPQAAAGPGAIDLEVRLVAGSGRVSLWTLEDRSTASHLLLGPPYHGAATVVRGLAGWHAPPSSLIRADLLAYLWSISTFAVWARWLLALSVCVAGLVVLSAFGESTAPRRRVLTAAGGAGLLLSGLALGYAIVTPPLFGSDEPDFLLSVAQVMEQPALAESTEALGHRTHLERIRHHGNQHFRAADVGNPWPLDWDPHVIFAEPIASRSPLTTWLWSATYTLIGTTSAAEMLWRFRVMHALLLGLTAAAAVAILVAALGLRGFPGLGLLVVPTLPFFGMAMGETAITVATAMLLAAIVAAIVLDADRSERLGVPLGIAIALVLLSGRRGWPILAATAVVLLARAVVGPRLAPGWRAALMFWGGLGGVVVPALWLAGSLGLFSAAAQVVLSRGRDLGPAVAWLLENALDRPWVLGAALAVPLTIELATARVRASGWLPAMPRLWPWVGALAAAALMITLIASWFIAFPTTDGARVMTTTFLEYLIRVAATMAIPFRAAHHDLMLSTLFWGGFGWSDAAPPSWLIGTLSAATGTMLAVTCWWAGRRGQARGLVLLGALGSGLGWTLVGTAAGAYALGYDVYGRYLIGWYLLSIVTAWVAAARWRIIPWPVWLAAAAAVHGYCTQMILARYL